MKKQNEHSADIEKWLQLANADGVGPVTFSKLLNKFGSVDEILAASVESLTKVDGIGYKTAERIARSRSRFDAEKELEIADRLGVHILTLDDPRYPPVLKRIYDPPILLYIKGELTRSDNLAIAIVGSRRSSIYGQEQASRFAHLLSSAGFTIVSGMARGIDTFAHFGALKAKQRTIAVTGCGLANVFPPENKKLFEQISQNGACISELPLTYEPLAQNFPSRNRIIAGLSLATIVIEASLKSGSLITARAAADYNREVMAVPGKIDSPLSKGSNLLIKQGAKLIDCIEDITENLGYLGEQLHSHVSESAISAEKALDMPLFSMDDLNLSSDEKTIFKCLSRDPIHIEDVITDTQLPAGTINASLISLRLKGLIKQLPGNMFYKN
ncbi:MAG: DNA-protecting protein DprA [Planctomycetes bacterium]|nr:DNA-protecting protein DprA [Planctomycetota bacterium]MBL7107561.1 DNA-protecting protein DprA [Phycisphaerae bacterium]